MNERNITPTTRKPERYDYSDDNRVDTVLNLHEEAKSQRTFQEYKWRTDDNYYDGIHRKVESFDDILKEDEKLKHLAGAINVTDPYVQIESQIMPEHPEPVFYGRDREFDSDKAKQREYVVKYILQINDFKSKNTSLDRAVRKYGDGIVKGFWDATMPDGRGGYGEIRLEVISLDYFYPDPVAKKLDGCEFVQFKYPLHRQAIKRKFGEQLKKKKIDIDDLSTPIGSESKIMEGEEQLATDDRLEVLEHWYVTENNRIGCVILIDEVEIAHIKDYWVNTGSQNRCYPFAHFWRIRNERKFWNLSELEPIIPLVNAMDDILTAGIENLRLMSKGKWIVEEDSVEGDIDNTPGGVITYKKGTLNPPRRDEGLKILTGTIENINFLESKVERTTRNYDTNQGKEATRTTTASGLAQLRADAQTQSKIKDFDMMQGYKRLFVLIDWLALEFYDIDKMIYIGVQGAKQKPQDGQASPMNIDPKQGDIYFTFNSSTMKQTMTVPTIDRTAVQNVSYYPLVDCDVVASNAIEKSKSFNVSVLQSMIGTPITFDNYKLVIKLVEELEIKGGQDIIADIMDKFENSIPFTPELEQYLNMMPPEQQNALRTNPKLAYYVFEQAKQAEPQIPNTAGIAQTSV